LLEGRRRIHLVEILEQFDHALHATGGAGDPGSGIGFGTVDDAQQEYRAFS
jgi:hypothetical protein